MNQSLRSLALACAGAGLLAACQPQAKSKPAAGTPAATAPESSTEATAPVAAVSATAPASASAADLPAFLTANNLAPLWQADFEQREQGSERPTILDGFYGPEHRHIAFILERVEQEAAAPGVFRVHGRSRYQKNIIPFAGTITVQALAPLTAALDLDSATEAHARAYTARARFVLREDPAAGAGTYQGTALMDFYRLPSGKLSLVRAMPGADGPTGGGGLLFRGQWESLRSGRRQEVAFAAYPEAVVPDALTDFYIGERGETVNPKYAKLGWNENWENEEWWAQSPKPSLHL